MTLSHKFDWLMLGLCSFIAAQSSQNYAQGGIDPESLKQILCFSFGGIGSVASGYAGSVLFPIKGLSFRQCWITNFICGFLLGPVVTYFAIAKYPHLPLPIMAAAVSFFLGAIGVKTLQYFLPKLLNLYARKTGLTRKQDREDGEDT